MPNYFLSTLPSVMEKALVIILLKAKSVGIDLSSISTRILNYYINIYHTAAAMLYLHCRSSFRPRLDKGFPTRHFLTKRDILIISILSLIANNLLCDLEKRKEILGVDSNSFASISPAVHARIHLFIILFIIYSLEKMESAEKSEIL